MLTVVWKYMRSVFGIFFRLLYPLKRVICRRRKLSSSEPIELTSIGTGDGVHVAHSFGGLQQDADEAEIEMEPWDSWGAPSQAEPPSSNYSYPPESHANNGHALHDQDDRKPPVSSVAHKNFYNKMAEPEPEPEINYFEDMTPSVKKQKKFLVRKKEQFTANEPTTNFSSRLAMTSAVPIQTSELDTWDDNVHAWGDEEASEDLTWQAEEAIRETKRNERLERQIEQQRRKQKKEEMRGMKGSSLAATKIS